VKNDYGGTVKSAVYSSIMATGHEQRFEFHGAIGDEPLDLPDGDYLLEVSVADTVYGSDPSHRKTAVFPFAVDRTPPVLNLNGDSTVTIVEGESFTDPGATATDNRDGDLTGGIVTTGTVDPKVPGTYELKYKVQDSVGNAAEAVRTVVVNARPAAPPDNPEPDPAPSEDSPIDPVSPGIGAPSGNNRLASLKLLDGMLEVALTPPFSPSTPAYTADSGSRRLTIVARPEHAAATVTVNGRSLPAEGLPVSLEVGDNEVAVTVRAENGDERTYTLTIRRSEPVCPFEDIHGHWAEENICAAFALGLVQGDSATRFVPDRAVTLLEMAVMLARLVGADDEAPLPFADASDIPAWAEETIGAAAAAGIVEGYPDGTFRPHRFVTREEVAAMLVGAARAAMAEGELPDERQTAGAAGRFADAPAISEWALGDVSIAAVQGWMEGREGGRFEPLANATRAEAATTILRLWKALHP